MKSSQVVLSVSLPSMLVPDRGKLDCFIQEGKLYREIFLGFLARKTPPDLLSGPYIFRFDLPEGRAYFTEDEGVFSRLQREGKTVRWLHELLEGWRKDLIVRQGLPTGTSIYNWPLGEVSFWLEAHRVLGGGRVLKQENPYQGIIL